MSHIPGAVGRAPEGTGWPLVEVQSAMTVEDDSGGVVPRFRRSYTHRQCEQRGKLRAFHWSDLEIDEVLGEPETTTPTGKPAYGSDRVILGSMMLESSSFWPWPSLVPVWKDVLLDDEDDEEEAKGRRAINEFATMDYAASRILRGLEIVLPIPQNLTLALTSTGRNYYGYCFTLFSNYNLDKSLPSAEEIKRIQTEFKFKCDPQWWPAFDFQWN